MPRRCLLLAVVLLLAFPLAVFADSGKDVVQAGEDYTVPAGSTAGDIVMLGGTLRVDGEVTGDVVVFGGTAIINGRVAGDVATFGVDTRLGENSYVGGDLAVLGGNLDRAKGAQVHGEVAHQAGKGLLAAIFVASLLVSIPFGIVMGLLGYAILRPQRINIMAEAVTRDLGTVILAGIGTVVVAIGLMALVARAHISHFPFHGIILIFLCIIMFVGYIGVSAWMGRRVSATSGPLAMVVIGAAIVSLLQAIPLVGIFAFLFFMLMALGIAVTTGFGTAIGWIRHAMG